MAANDEAAVREALREVIRVERRYAHDRRNSTTERRREIVLLIEKQAKSLEAAQDADQAG